MALTQEEIAKQAALMRDMTRTTGVVFEFQVLQLRRWPMVVIPGAVGAEIAVDVEGWRVDFDVKTSPDAAAPTEDVLAGLGRSVRWLLGDGFDVGVTCNGVRVFDDRGDVIWRTRSRKPVEAEPSLQPVIPEKT